MQCARMCHMPCSMFYDIPYSPSADAFSSFCFIICFISIYLFRLRSSILTWLLQKTAYTLQTPCNTWQCLCRQHSALRAVSDVSPTLNQGVLSLGLQIERLLRFTNTVVKTKIMRIVSLVLWHLFDLYPEKPSILSADVDIMHLQYFLCYSIWW